MSKDAFMLLAAMATATRCECGRYHMEVHDDFMEDTKKYLAHAIDQCHEEAIILNCRFAEDRRIYLDALEMAERVGPVQTIQWKIQVKEDAERLAERQRRLEIVLMACETKQRNVH